MTIMAEFLGQHLPMYVGDDEPRILNDANEIGPEGNAIRTITFGNNNGGIQIVGGLSGGVTLQAGGISIQPAQIGTRPGSGVTIGGVSTGGVQTASIGGSVEVTSTKNGHNITFSTRGDSVFGAGSSVPEAAQDTTSQAIEARDHALETRQQATAERREALARVRAMRAEARPRAAVWVDRMRSQEADDVEEGDEVHVEDGT